MVRKWWCQIELKIEDCEFCLRKMLQMTEVRIQIEKLKEMKFGNSMYVELFVT